MSDSESDCDWRASEEDSSKDIAFLDDNITIINPKCPLLSGDALFEEWDKISEQDKRVTGRLMKITAFWLPILLQRDESSTIAHWAAQIGLVEPYKDLNLKHIQKIEILEAVLRALVKGTLKKAQTKQVICISNRFHLHSPEVLENALQWLERTGEPNIRQKILDFGHLDVCFKALHLIFVEFSQYIKSTALSYEATLLALVAHPGEALERRCEEMKRKGNEHFQNKMYDDAVKFYSKALKFHPDNHMVYGNRALCYIKCNNFQKALGDGKKAILIKPDWAKGHYRYCEALFGLGEVSKALEANTYGLSQVQDDPEGRKDLETQQLRFSQKLSQVSGSDFETKLKWSASQSPVRSQSKEASPRPPSPKPKEKKPAPVKKEPEPKVEKKTQPANNKSNKARTSSPAQTKNPENKPGAKSSAPPTQKVPPKPAPEPVHKPAPEPVHKPAEQKTEAKPKETKTKNTQNGPKKGSDSVCKELSAAVTDGHSALENLRSRNAEQAFSRALSLLGQGNNKVPGVTSIDVLLLQFGRASALTQIGRPEELSEALQVLDRIQASEERTFQCLVCLAYGRIYVKENRFKTALPHFFDAQKIVKNQITPGILTWPLTSHIVPETQLDYLTEILDKSIDICRFPPLPDAVCRIENCSGSVKKEIYFTDPDFKGFIQIRCCESCSVEYHISCWKNLKTKSFFEKSDKEFLHNPCFTPDCRGQIDSIKIFGPTGLVKCKFEVAIPRPVALKKVKVNQECTSLKKLQSKEERRLRRKQFKQTSGDPEGAAESAEGQDSASAPAARLHFRDHVLLQISQHVELLRGESSSCVSTLTATLTPWLQLDLGRGNEVSARLLQTLEEPSVTLGAAVELLLERRNRVWGRLLIQVLSDCEDVQPRVSGWAKRLDSAGLSAASFFMDQHSSDLEQLDLSLLFSFSPVQDLIIEKLGSHPELFSSLGLSVTEYLRQSSSRDQRMFVWALEEHRQHYSSVHSLLDHYFDMMDGLCSVLKKSEENNISSPSKSKTRVKKKKTPKPVLVWNSPRTAPVAEDWGPGLVDDDSLSFLDQPFSVPPHLRQQVASFEQQYNGNSSFTPDNRPQPSKDTLYEYFSQILSEHGPLSPDDPLLVGELRNFPASLQLQIQSSGGLEPFLLSSPAFTRVGGCLALTRIETPPFPTPQDSLDQLDTIEGGSGPTSPLFNSPGFFTFLRETFPTLPNPYDLYTERGDARQSPPSEGEAGGFESRRRREERGELLSVAVNTEEIQEFERFQGDLTAVMKQHWDMRAKISSVPEDRVRLKEQRSRELKALEEEVTSATASVQVTQKELSLFQHKLEEEVKKDQKEKKEHQEKLKSLKLETEALQQEKNRMKKTIKEKNSAHQSRLRDFLELRNQSAAERLSLEEEIKRCKEAVKKAAHRSLSAQLLVLESAREKSLCCLHRELADNRAVLHRLGDIGPRFAHQEMESAQKHFLAAVNDFENKISSTQAHYEQQLNELKSESQISEVQSEPETPSSAAAALEQASGPEVTRDQASPLAPPPVAPAGGATAAAAAQKKKKHRKAPQEVAPPTVFERAVDRLAAIFPHISRSELSGLIQRFRSSSGSLSALSLQEVVGGVSQLILDQQEEQSRVRAAQGSNGRENSAPVWQPLEPHRNIHPNALNVEDPCIICHEDMSEDDLCVLECRHSFHRECIKSWLKEQSTCPTCRDHTLLLEDFPTLSSQATRRH